MESSLHRELKARYGIAREVRRGPYRADAVAPDGTWIEVQSGALGPLRAKLRALLPEQAVRVVKPVVVSRVIVRAGSGASRPRRSPWRGDLADVFEDFVGLATVFPNPNLTVDVLAVEIEEHRETRRRRPGYAVVDRRLLAIRETVPLSRAEDLWRLLPSVPAGDKAFTTVEIAGWLGCPRARAQRVAYCLRLTGAVEIVGRGGSGVVYRRAGEVARPRRRALDATVPMRY